MQTGLHGACHPDTAKSLARRMCSAALLALDVSIPYRSALMCRGAVLIWSTDAQTLSRVWSRPYTMPTRSDPSVPLILSLSLNNAGIGDSERIVHRAGILPRSTRHHDLARAPSLQLRCLPYEVISCATWLGGFVQAAMRNESIPQPPVQMRQQDACITSGCDKIWSQHSYEIIQAYYESANQRAEERRRRRALLAANSASSTMADEETD